eukprot:11617274-Alexandrium_andersonii.AAC.1
MRRGPAGSPRRDRDPTPSGTGQSNAWAGRLSTTSKRRPQKPASRVADPWTCLLYTSPSPRD